MKRRTLAIITFFILLISILFINVRPAEAACLDTATKLKLIQYLIQSFDSAKDSYGSLLAKILDIIRCGDSSGEDDGLGNVSGSEIGDITAYIEAINVSFGLNSTNGLPEPNEDGANMLLEYLNRSEHSRWVTKGVLDGEKKLKDSLDLIRYLTTAWIWFEGASGYPNVYSINCNDEGDASSKVSVYCPHPRSGDFQIAGYQVGDRQNQFKTVYEGCYGGSDSLLSVMQEVVDRSSNTEKPGWSYTKTTDGLVNQYLPGGQVPQNVSYDTDIGGSDVVVSSGVTPEKERKQFYSLIAGKDRCMAAGLNSYAVKGQAQQIITCSGWAGYVCNANGKQTLSNMIAALWMFETGSTSLTPQPTTDPNVTGIPTGPPENADILEQVAYWAERISANVSQSYCAGYGGKGTWYCALLNPPKNEANGKEATYRKGVGTGTCADCLYNCTRLTADAGNLAKGVDLNLSEGAAVQATQMETKYLYYPLFKGDAAANIKNVRRGCFMYHETVHGVQVPGGQHASTVKSITVDSAGNGSVTTLDTTSPKKEYTFPIKNSQVKNAFHPLISFGCLQ